MNSPVPHVKYGFVVEPKDLTRPLVSQVHGAELVEVTGPAHREALQLLPLKADGVWTKQRDVELHVFSADCLPVLFFGENSDSPIAAVHSGWRGARQGIVKTTVELLTPAAPLLHVVLGPCIMGCCFEVKDDFVHSWEQAGKNIQPFLEKSRGRMFFDLPRYVREVDLAGIPDNRVHQEENRCTYCTAPPLPSFRRNGGTDPRIRAWVRKRSL